MRYIFTPLSTHSFWHSVSQWLLALAIIVQTPPTDLSIEGSSANNYQLRGIVLVGLHLRDTREQDLNSNPKIMKF